MWAGKALEVMMFGVTMRASLNRLIAKAHLDAVAVRAEAEFLCNVLDEVRSKGEISNDAFLDAGVVHGGLEMLANHIDLGVSQKELQEMLREQLSRANRIAEKHPTLDETIESKRG